MDRDYTLKGLKCPYCGSENISVRGAKGSMGKAAAAMAFGAVGALVASSSVSDTAEVAEMQYRCEECNKSFEAMPLTASEEDTLEQPCSVTFIRESSMIGAAVVQVVYVNGVKLGVVKNGQSIQFNVSNRYNTLFVTDATGIAFPDVMRFEAAPGAAVTFRFNRKFLDAGGGQAVQSQPGAPKKKKHGFLYVLGIIIQTIGYLLALGMFSSYISDTGNTDWTGAWLGVVGFIVFIAAGILLTKKSRVK